MTARPKLRGRRCRCGGCDEHFASLHAFDRHRYGAYTSRGCRTAAELAALGWSQDIRGFWRTPGNGRPTLAYVPISGDRPDPAPSPRVRPAPPCAQIAGAA